MFLWLVISWTYVDTQVSPNNNLSSVMFSVNNVHRCISGHHYTLFNVRLTLPTEEEYYFAKQGKLPSIGCCVCSQSFEGLNATFLSQLPNQPPYRDVIVLLQSDG